MNEITIKDAARRWVSEFNAIPKDMILKLMQYASDEWTELTMPRTGDRVYVFCMPEDCEEYCPCGTIEDVLDDTYAIDLDDDNTIKVGIECFEVEYDGRLPAWGTMWSFGNSADDYWLENEDGIRIMSNCGFRIYEHDEFGYFFGIDGGGYSFFEEHFLPLYKSRGLQWHDPETEEIAL